MAGTQRRHQAHYQEILRAFYRQPRVLKHYVELSVKHPSHVGRLLSFGAGAAVAKLKAVFRGKGQVLVPESSAQLH